MQKNIARTAVAVCVSSALIAGGAYHFGGTNETTSYQLSPEKQAFLAAKKAKKDKSPKRYDKPQEAHDFYVKQRAPLGEQALPTEKYAQAVQHMADMAQYSFKTNKQKPSRNQLRGSSLTDAKMTDPGVIKEWSNIGPGNIGGRTRALIIDPETPDTMYAAGVAGGIWKTTNAGQSWAALDDMMLNLAVTTLAFSPTDSNTIYAGTGEGFFNGDALRGDGIFKSTDGGATWSQLASTGSNTAFRYVNKVEASATVEGRVYAVTRAGVYRSNDGGTSWDEIMEAPDRIGCLDLKVRTDLETDELLVSCGSFDGATVYRSTDAGETFTPVIEDELLGRTTLAYAPSNQNIVYALASSNRNDTSSYRYGFYKLFRSADGGATWEVKNSTTNPNTISTLLLSNPVFAAYPECGWGPNRSFYNQGWYDNIIQVDPANPDIVWTGGIDLWRSDDAGANWDAVSRWWDDVDSPHYAHADQHTIVFHPDYDGDTNKTLFVGNDGGIQRTDNADSATLGVPGICGADVADTVTWTGLNNSYSVTQFYHGTAAPDGSFYFGGTQDNGTNIGYEVAGPENWAEIAGGDGGWVAFDPRTPNAYFAEYTGLSLRRWREATGWQSITAGIDGAGLFPFITPFMMDDNNPDILWIGNNRLWRTNDQGDTWVQASAPIIDNSIVSEWAVAPGNSDRVIAGTDSGLLLISTAATEATSTTQWHSVKPTAGYVSDIAISPTNNLRAYATYSTFGVPHIWRTSDGGLTWQPIDKMGQPNGLPDIPVNTVVIDPTNTSRVIVGTDMGIFISVDGGMNWSVDGSGFANTAVAHLEIKNGELFAFTHGRSAYKVELSTLPSAISTSVTTDEDTAIAFSDEMFGTFSGGTPTVESIVFHQLPENGNLMVGDTEITELAPIAIADIDNLTFVPTDNFNGETSIGWNAEAAGAATSTNADITIIVNPVNDAPVFSLTPGTTKVEFGHQGIITVATVTPATIPSDEAEQMVTYSVTPKLLDFANVEINETTGELSVVQIGESEGIAKFTITANDHQNANNTHSESIEFEVKKPKGGSGSLGWFAMLLLPLAALRRRFS
ncbi:GlyGly-CTERM sorting domain-containing protein [Aliikangiella sp. IMCC44359]|uniref:GlyGly-CTERM sorting domain-containing protein n=1 Tax=Aliikangiella sp. IMCC44359 TaxID=3459125 RepID=UPI00403A9DC8